MTTAVDVTVGLGGRVEIRFDVEHATTKLVVGLERKGATPPDERVFQMPTAEITPLSTPPEGFEVSYLFTSPPFQVKGIYACEAATQYGVVVESGKRKTVIIAVVDAGNDLVNREAVL